MFNVNVYVKDVQGWSIVALLFERRTVFVEVSNFGGGGFARNASSPTDSIRMGSCFITMFSVNACLKDVQG